MPSYFTDPNERVTISYSELMDRVNQLQSGQPVAEERLVEEAVEEGPQPEPIDPNGFQPINWDQVASIYTTTARQGTSASGGGSRRMGSPYDIISEPSISGKKIRRKTERPSTRTCKKFKGVLLDENDKPIKGSDFTGYQNRPFKVSGIVYAHKPDENEYYFLLYKDSLKDSPNFGKWTTASTHLRYDEDRIGALERGLYVKFGLKTKGYEYKDWKIADQPNGKEQEILSVFLVEMTYIDLYKQLNHYGYINTDTKSRGGRSGIVGEIKLVPFADLENYKLDDNLRRAIDNFIDEFVRI